VGSDAKILQAAGKSNLVDVSMLVSVCASCIDALIQVGVGAGNCAISCFKSKMGADIAMGPLAAATS
jgi:hypothetical protein